MLDKKKSTKKKEEKYKGAESDRAAKRMLDIAGVSYRKVPAFEVEIKKENQ